MKTSRDKHKIVSEYEYGENDLNNKAEKVSVEKNEKIKLKITESRLI